jgi:hypothetical protein
MSLPQSRVFHLLTSHPSRPQLFLRYSLCFVSLEMYSPFVHHVAQPQDSHSAFAYAYGSKCVEAAVSAVWTAQELDKRGMLDEAWCLTVDVLAMAATTLLVVGLGSPLETTAGSVGDSSSAAKVLMEKLARRNASAAKCLESLTVSNNLNQVSLALTPRNAGF